MRFIKNLRERQQKSADPVPREFFDKFTKVWHGLGSKWLLLPKWNAAGFQEECIFSAPAVQPQRNAQEKMFLKVVFVEFLKRQTLRVPCNKISCSRHLLLESILCFKALFFRNGISNKLQKTFNRVICDKQCGNSKKPNTYQKFENVNIRLYYSVLLVL